MLVYSIGYSVTLEKLRITTHTLTRHLEPGVVVVVEPWLTPDAIRHGYVRVLLAEAPALKVAPM